MKRQIFFKIDTVFIENNSLNIARKAFSEQTKLGWAANSIPNTSHIHESEIPDADIIPYNEFITWYYSISSKVVSKDYVTTELIQNGKKLNKKIADSLWNTILEANQYLLAPRTVISGIPRVQIQLSNTDKEKTLENIFQEMNIEIRKRKITKKEVQTVDRKIKVFIPVRILKNEIYLCKNLIDYFKLSSNNLNTDLFDMNGTLASFNFSYEVEYVDQESFTYLRKDLLDKYLKEMQLTMVSIVWGERDYYPPDGDWMRNTKNLSQRKWAEFYKAIVYNPEV